MIHANRILLSMGTRPEIIKMMPVYFALKERGANPILLHTGQHSDMAEELYDLFDIKPDYSLSLQRDGASKASDLADLSSALLRQSSEVINACKPDVVLVHGDTSSALMVALAAFYGQCAIGHIEAGLRSYNEYNPFPEEKNRVLIGRLAHWHFAPTARAAENLTAEGIAENQIHIVGNTIVGATHLGAQHLQTYRARKSLGGTDDLVSKLEKRAAINKLVLVTAHRRENHELHIRTIANSVREMLLTYPDITVVWPVHPNPKVKQQVYAELADLPPSAALRLYLTNPLSYPVLLWILKNSWLVMTDSGGIQEEAVALQTPVLVLRDTTERPEVIETGAGKLIGTQKKNILKEFANLYNSPAKHRAMTTAKNPFGDKNAAGRIADLLLGNSSLTETKHYA